MKEHGYFVYLMASRTRVLYCGMTNNLIRRVAEHKSGEVDGFSKTYRCNRLVWFEHYQYVANAINRERQMKCWNRAKKIARIEEANPSWSDPSEEWFSGVESAGPSAPLRSGRDDKGSSVLLPTPLRCGRDDRDATEGVRR